MGCGRICRAKKKAAAAKRDAERQQAAASAQAADAQKQADAMAAMGQGFATDITITSYSTETVTVAKYLGIDKKKNALSIREMQVLLQTAKRSPQIMAQAAAKNLVAPLATAMGVYNVLDTGRKVFLVVKPGIKIAMQINDAATCNFAAIGEMISDIAQMILQILIGFAPMLIELLKNIFLDIPLYVKTITKEQTIRIQNMITMSQVNVRDRISNTLTNFDVGKQGCPSVIDALALLAAIEDEINSIICDPSGATPELEDLTNVPALRQVLIDYIIAGLECARKTVLQDSIEEVNKEAINVLQVPDMANAETEDKQTMKAMLDGLLTVTKKVELAKTEELLRRNFVASQETPTEEVEKFADKSLAEAAADTIIQKLRDMIVLAVKEYNKNGRSTCPSLDITTPAKQVLNSEIQMRLDRVEETRGDIITLTVVEEIMQSNKIQLLQNAITVLKDIQFDPNIFDLNDCISYNINSDFNTLKTNIDTANGITISTTPVATTAEMEALRTQVYNDTVQAINDELIEIRDTCGFIQQVCDAVELFKSNLVLTIKQNLDKTTINIVLADYPDYIDPLKLKRMLKTFNDAINVELYGAAKVIILEDIMPCKSCKPCEQIQIELEAYAKAGIEKIKDEMIRISGVYINDEALVWDITTDAQSIIDAKQQLENISTAAMQHNSGYIDLYDTFIQRLRLEEKELLKSLNTVIKNL